MRWSAFFLSVLVLGLGVLGPSAQAEENPPTVPTLALLKADSAKAKIIKKGEDLAKKYLKAEWELEVGKKGASLSKVETARAKWRTWMDQASEAMGINLSAHPRIVIEIITNVRAAIIGSGVKLKKGTIDYGSKPAPGFSRGDISYSVLVPKTYNAVRMEKSMPLVVSMHGRAINLRHPAVKKYQEQRSRIVLWNNWGGSRKGVPQDAIVIAPTGAPDGWRWIDAKFDLRQAMFLAAGVGCSDYRVDSRGLFVEVYGDALIDAIEMNSFFAGIILRDRKGAKRPALSGDQLALLENLNGKPLYYIAEAKNFAAVGKPLVDALTAVYKAAGKPDNFVYEKAAPRDANSALLGTAATMTKFLQHRLPDAQRELTWLFWRPSMIAPMPILLSRAGYDYDDSEEIAKLPLKDKCGLVKMKAEVTTIKEGEKEIPINLIEMEIYEADSVRLFLYEPLVDLDLPITLKVNGAVVVDKEMVRRDWKLFEKFCMPRKIFTFPIVGVLDAKFPYKVRVEPKKEETKEGEAKEDDAKEAESEDAVTADK